MLGQALAVHGFGQFRFVRCCGTRGSRTETIYIALHASTARASAAEQCVGFNNVQFEAYVEDVCVATCERACMRRTRRQKEL